MTWVQQTANHDNGDTATTTMTATT